MTAGKASIGYRVLNGIAHVTLSNPAKMNAMTFGMWSSLPAVMAQAGQDAEVRLIVVAGDGDKAFCAGADISEFSELRTGEAAVAAYNAAVAEGNAAITAATKPTVAVIRGICFGGGFGLAMGCDLRLATSDARFRVPAARLGLGYDARNIAMLVSRIGMAGVTDLLLSAGILDATDALRYGIVNRVWDRVDFDANVGNYLGQMAGNAVMNNITRQHL